MVKVRPPLYSLAAHGWLGHVFYARRRVVVNPYPFGFFPRYLVHSNYYSPVGWTYQRRRTWHGIVWTAERPPYSVMPRTSIQQGYLFLFYEAVKAWQGLTPQEKDVYNKWKYPVYASGYNRFLRWYLKTHTAMPLFWGNLQKSVADSDTIEQEMLSQVLTDAPAADHSVSGVKINLTAAVAVNFGDVCYIDSNGKAALADADAIASSSSIVMCADASIAQNASGNFLLFGIARDDTWNWTVGGLVYISTTGTSGNTLTQTAPSGTDDVIQIVGVATHADRLFFNPSLVQVEHT